MMNSLLAAIATTKAKVAAAAVAGVAVVGGGGYYGVYLPNTPENTLKSSVTNTLKLDQRSGKGKASFTGKDAPGVTLDYSLQDDAVKPALGGNVEVAVSGVKVPFEFRAVEKSAYLKVGDLSTVQSLANNFAGPEATPAIKQVADKIQNKWIEFDESLIKTAAGQDCDLFGAITSNDEIDKIAEIYSKNDFATIKNTSEDNVDGRDVTKYDLGFDKEKAKAFVNELKNIESFKKAEACGQQNGDQNVEDSVDDFKGNVEVSAWVDEGKKELVKMFVKVSDEQGTFEADFVFNKETVDIQKPDGAVPAMQILGELGPLFGGFSGMSGSNGQNGADGMDGADGLDGFNIDQRGRTNSN
jgi:hypothetical protein